MVRRRLLDDLGMPCACNVALMLVVVDVGILLINLTLLHEFIVSLVSAVLVFGLTLAVLRRIYRSDGTNIGVVAC